MMNFTIEGQPRPQQRHRQVTKGNTRFAYDPSAKEKKEFLAKAIQYKPETPYDFPITVELEFHFQRSKKHFYTGKRSNILREDSPFYRSSTPDIDNLIKFVTDALNKVFWVDDAIICEVIAYKAYSLNSPARTLIKVRKL